MFQLVVLSALAVIGTLPITRAQNGPEGCVAASCSTFQQINTLYCHANPAWFCQCRPGLGNVWILQVMTCPEPETVFSFRHQVCVHPSMRDEAECDPAGAGDGPDDTDIEDDVDRACELAPCGTFEEINTLTCHPDVKRFCQCRPISTQPEDPNRGLFVAIAMPCAEGTSFSFRQQTCARDELWVDSCPP
ncbi:uncharacterized protein LOC5570410 [Aedes aegypti]|uniref:Uncharacterized protein n=1 Tax=Aedes aegypti TaxID=7159 RepID=A0A1S4FJ32_AEDAE|nr:uncharacterized protein LOC5570410 [Aedes aegypti]